ncbi:MAG: hypothetical protein MRY63_11330 [Neomegalonema sp.]|nr:hypothetical protein [Neomegalonema sp.]
MTNVDNGADTAAAPIRDYEKLTKSQKMTVRRVLLRTYEIAELEVRHRDENPHDPRRYLSRQFTRRPQNVFLIDGARGAGKTTLMFTIRWIMGYLGRPTRLANDDPRQRADDFLKKVRGELSDEYAGVDAGSGGEQSAGGGGYDGSIDNLRIERVLKQPQAPKSLEKPLSTVCTLRVLFPSDLEMSQPLLEGIFAMMDEKIDQEIRQRSSTEERLKSLESLKRKLNEEVVSGWYLSQPEGQEAILRESLNVDHYFEVRGRYSGKSFSRVNEWRRFVNEFLDTMGFQLLGIFLDDTDVRPEMTADMLNSIRVFLDHPRIVTLVAGNVKSMRDSLLLTAMDGLSNSIRALSRPDDADAHEWRRNLRHQTEEYLDKVLPRFNRFFLGLEAGDGENKDFETIIQLSFEEFCKLQLKRFEADYMHVRISDACGAPFNIDQKGSPISVQNKGASLENYISWWLYWTVYGVELRPRSIRQLRTLSRFTRPEPNSDLASRRLKAEHGKRLAVVLFEAPDNYALSHRFGDQDVSVITWLRRQAAHASWTGERHFEINDRKLFSGEYSYDYLCFRMDLEIALPTPLHVKSLPPKGLLPIPAGPSFVGHNPFFASPKRRQRQYGASSVLDHIVIPANCLYFSDMQYLPEIAWQDQKSTHSIWDNNLIYNWRTLFSSTRDHGFSGRDLGRALEDCFLIKRVASDGKVPYLGDGPLEKMMGELLRFAGDLSKLVDFESKSRPKGEKFKGKYVKAVDKFIEEYWSEIVIPMASLDLTKFEVKNPVSQSIDGRLVASEMNNNHFESSIDQIEYMRRNFDYLCHLSGYGAGQAAVSQVAGDVVRQANDKIFVPLIRAWSDDEIRINATTYPDWLEMRRLSRHATDYAWLVNHVRRAWHAGRIFAGQIATIERIGGSTELLRANTVPQVQRYSILKRVDVLRMICRAFAFVDAKKINDPLALLGQIKLGLTPDNATGAAEMDAWLMSQISAFAPIERKYQSKMPKVKEDRKSLSKYVDASWKRVCASAFLCNVLGDHSKMAEITQATQMLDKLSQTQKNDVESWAQSLRPGHAFPGSLFAPRLEAQKTEQAYNDRLRIKHALFERSLVLFVWGLAPSLPALIHLEVSAILYDAPKEGSPSRNYAERKDAAREALKSWKILVNWLNRYCIRSRAGIEHDALQLLLNWYLQRRDGGAASEDRPIIPTRFPDVAMSTLGIAGPAALYRALKGEGGKDTAVAKLIEESLRKLHLVNRGEKGVEGEFDGSFGSANATGSRKWHNESGVFHDIERHLDAALEYCVRLERAVDENPK